MRSWTLSLLLVSAAACVGGLIRVTLSERNIGADNSSSPSFSFGRVASGTVLFHTFDIINNSSSSVTILSAKSSCGCTVATPDGNEVPANGSTEISVDIDTTGKSGPMLETVHVQLSDGSMQEFSTTANVEGFRIATLDFGEVRKGETSLVRGVSIDWPLDSPLTVEDITFDEGVLRVVHDSLPAEHRERFQVSLTSGIPYGIISEEVRVKTNDPVLKSKSVSVIGNVLYPIAVEPTQVLLGEFKPGEKKSASIRVYSPYGHPLEIEKTEVLEGKPVDWTYTEISKSEYRMDVVVEENRYVGESIMKSVVRVWAIVNGESHRIVFDIYGLRSKENAPSPI